MAESFLLFEACDFVGFPAGGQLTMARHIMTAFAGDVALVGIDTDGTAPVGAWSTRRIEGIDYPFFAIRHRTPSASRPLVPARIATYAALLRHRSKILSLGVRRAFCQGHETLLAIAGWPWQSLAYDFPGVANPLGISRYRWARPLASAFDRLFFRALTHADVVLATADAAAIAAMCERSGGLLAPHDVGMWPTRVDTDVFKPGDALTARKAAGLPSDKLLIVTSGRLNWVKGWPLLLEALVSSDPRWHLVFVGDGEDREALLARAAELGVDSKVTITGTRSPPEVARYVQAADVFAMASHHEGFSTSMLEALACGKPIVTTAVSSATTIVESGVNGFVVSNRDSIDFRKALNAAMHLSGRTVKELSMHRVVAYAASNIHKDLQTIWPAIAAGRSLQMKEKVRNE
jgi:glycosyltransferase involved in cell wall biosynthesis